MDQDEKKLVVGVPRETFPGERRAALVPAAVPTLLKGGMEVLVEQGAGEASGYPDTAYQEKGARILERREQIFAEADLILQVRCLGANPEAGKADLDQLRPDQVLIGLCEPLSTPEAAQALADRGVVLFSMELMPRITRAQGMDVLSSMATVAGYRAVLIAADLLPRMFPMMMTAAGTLAPARVFVVGAGVAGLQAIATARRLGGVVSAYDVRPAVKEQVESLGAKFIELDLETGESEDKGGYAKAMDEEFYRKQREMMGKVLAESDVVITTAAVPGKKAPILITGGMAAGMAPGSVIVDLAAERGGNCELTRPGETVIEKGVTITGPLNLPSEVPYHASQMYARNCVNFVLHLVKEGRLDLDREDEIIAGTLVTRGKEVVHPAVRKILGLEADSDEGRDA